MSQQFTLGFNSFVAGGVGGGEGKGWLKGTQTGGQKLRRMQEEKIRISCTDCPFLLGLRIMIFFFLFF